MHPMKEMIQDKEIEQRQSRVWDLGKFQVTTLEQQQHDITDGQRHRVWDPGGLQHIENHEEEAMQFCTLGV